MGVEARMPDTYIEVGTATLTKATRQVLQVLRDTESASVFLSELDEGSGLTAQQADTLALWLRRIRHDVGSVMGMFDRAQQMAEVERGQVFHNPYRRQYHGRFGFGPGLTHGGVGGGARSGGLHAQYATHAHGGQGSAGGLSILRGNAHVKPAMEHHFGHELSDAEVTHLLGARASDTIMLKGYGPTLLEVRHFGPGYNARTDDPSQASFTAMHYLVKTPSGEKLDDLHYVHVANSGQGEGAARVAGMVRGLRDAGFHYIRLDAARGRLGNGIMANGYYTWPRFGWTAPLARGERAVLPRSLAGARQVRHLFRTQEGRDWWREHGGLHSMRFYLQGNTPSVRMFNAYLHAKGLPSL